MNIVRLSSNFCFLIYIFLHPIKHNTEELVILIYLKIYSDYNFKWT